VYGLAQALQTDCRESLRSNAAERKPRRFRKRRRHQKSTRAGKKDHRQRRQASGRHRLYSAQASLSGNKVKQKKKRRDRQATNQNWPIAIPAIKVNEFVQPRF